MTAEIIAIGSELTCGAKLDTNSQWLSQELELLGWRVTRHTALADAAEELAEEFRAAAARSQVVLITGGLGPTLDDVTRDALALAFDDPLVEDAESLVQMTALFAARGREMPERNRRQALRPRSAVSLRNSCGTAPGILMRLRGRSSGGAADECILAALPGVPVEMKQMFAEQVRPQLTDSRAVVERLLVRTFGLGESDVEQRLGDLTARGRNPEVGITASGAVITLSVTARGESREVCRALQQPIVEEIHRRLGDAVFGVGDLELQDCVAAELRSRRLRIACREGAATGGLIAHWLCDDPAHEEFLIDARLRPGVADSRDSENLREPQATWRRRFQQEAETILASTDVDYVILTSAKWDAEAAAGVPGRFGFVAAAGRRGFVMHDVMMTGNRAIFRVRAARTALNILRLLMRQEEVPRDGISA